MTTVRWSFTKYIAIRPTGPPCRPSPSYSEQAHLKPTFTEGYRITFPIMKYALSLTLFVAVVGAWQTYIVQHIPNSDDTPALLKALTSGNITTNTTILFQKGSTYNIFTPIKFPLLTNVEVRIEGNLTYPEDIATIQGRRPRISLLSSFLNLHISIRSCWVLSKVTALHSTQLHSQNRNIELPWCMVCPLGSHWGVPGKLHRFVLGLPFPGVLMSPYEGPQTPNGDG